MVKHILNINEGTHMLTKSTYIHLLNVLPNV